MEKLLETIFLGKGVQRFRLLTNIYLLVVSVWLSNYIMNALGYYFLQGQFDATLGQAIAFALSKEAILTVTVFAGVCLFLYRYTHHLYFFLSLVMCKVFKFSFSITMFLLCAVVGALIFKFRTIKIFPFKDFLNLFSVEEMAIIAKFVSRKDGVFYTGERFGIFKEIAQDVIEDGNMIEKNVNVVLTILFSTWLVLYLNELYMIIPNVYTIIKCSVIYYGFNTIVVLWLIRKEDKLEELLLNTKYKT